MFKLVTVERFTESSPARFQCQIVAYKGKWIVDTDYFPDAVECIRWAIPNADWATKFEIYNDNNLKVKIVGVVGENNVITWGDHPLN